MTFRRSFAHRTPAIRVLLAGLACVALAAGLTRVRAQSAPAAAGSPCDITTTSRVVAVGDVHGALDKLVAILREVRLIDGRQRWIGGKAMLVQVGDVLDRGAQSRQVLDLIRRLEGEAARAGGQVLFLLGDHEMMRMAGDLRYVSGAEYDAFKSSEARGLRDRLYEYLVSEHTAQARAKGETFDAEAFRKTFFAGTPLGSVEMQMAFAESGEYGPWLRQHDVMARINGIVFSHAGPNVAFAALGCDGTNARARTEVKTTTLSDPGWSKTLLWSADGPLWYRGLADGGATAATGDDVTAILTALGASRIVVGHTTSPSRRIQSLFDGRVLQIDTGMLGGEYFPGGAPAALEIQGGTFTAIYLGARDVLIQGLSAGSARPRPPATYRVSPSARR